MALAKKYLERIELQYRDDDGYWISLKYGWKNGLDPLGLEHGIHEDTKTQALEVLRMSMPCECEECRPHEEE